MKLPKVKKQLSDLLSGSDKLASKSKQVAVGILMVAIGGFASPVHSVIPAVEPSSISAERKNQSAEKLVLQQPSLPDKLHAQHYSHYSHSSHYSHTSHYSHYSHYSSR